MLELILFILIISVCSFCAIWSITTLEESEKIKRSTPPPYTSIKSRSVNIQDQFFNSDNSKSGNDDV